MTVVGVTTDNREVVDFFQLYDTFGLELDMLLDHLNRANLVPSWTHFYEQALAKGWNPRSTRSKLETAVLDVYGPHYFAEWKKRLDLYVEWRLNGARPARDSAADAKDGGLAPQSGVQDD